MRGLRAEFPCVCRRPASRQAREHPGSFFEVVADAKREPSYLVILTKKGRIRRLDAMTGRATWTVTPPTPPPWRPRVLAGAVVASGQMDMSVFALDPESGRIRWVIDRSDPEWAGIGRAHCVESDGTTLSPGGASRSDPNAGRGVGASGEPHGPCGGWRVTVFLKSVGTRLVTEFGYLDAETGRTLQRFVDMEGRARADVEWAGLPLVAVSDDGRVMLLEDGGRVTRVPTLPALSIGGSQTTMNDTLGCTNSPDEVRRHARSTATLWSTGEPCGPCRRQGACIGSVGGRLLCRANSKNGLSNGRRPRDCRRQCWASFRTTVTADGVGRPQGWRIRRSPVRDNRRQSCHAH